MVWITATCRILPIMITRKRSGAWTCLSWQTWHTAPGQPQNVSVITSDLTNKTKLKWDVPKGKAPAGYYVLMRETISPYWEKKFYVTDTNATIGYSKDNYLFAVQAVDAAWAREFAGLP
jgi:hypothetical protein